MKQITNLQEIQLFIFMLEKLEGRIYNNYEELKKDLAKELNINVSIENITKSYEPTAIEEEDDVRTLYRTLFNE